MFRKALFAVVVSLSCSVAGGLQAQELSEQQAANAQWLSQFGTIAGAWALNERCGHITGDALQTFEKDVAAINVSFMQRYGAANILRTQRSGRKVANSEKYSCSDATREIVTGAAAIAHSLRPDVDYADREQEVGFLSLALGGAQRCLDKDDPQLAVLTDAHAKVLSSARELVPGESFDDTVNEYLAQGRQGPKPACGEEANAMGVSLVGWATRRQKIAYENR